MTMILQTLRRMLRDLWAMSMVGGGIAMIVLIAGALLITWALNAG